MYTNKIILQSWKYIFINICIQIYIKLNWQTRNSLPQEQDNKWACSLTKLSSFLNQRFLELGWELMFLLSGTYTSKAKQSFQNEKSSWLSGKLQNSFSSRYRCKTSTRAHMHTHTHTQSYYTHTHTHTHTQSYYSLEEAFRSQMLKTPYTHTHTHTHTHTQNPP